MLKKINNHLHSPLSLTTIHFALPILCLFSNQIHLTMKTNKLFFALSMIVAIGLLTQCEKYGDRGGPPPPDDDSDRPAWAGGNTDVNPHSKGNDDSGTKKGGDYGDLYILDRDVNGLPNMVQVVEGGEWYVQPIAEDGSAVELNEEGEVVNPEEAQEVEFGRLNLVRSPTSVLDQGLSEALKVLAAPGAVISLDFCGRLTSTYPDGDEVIVKTIDSPYNNFDLNEMPSYNVHVRTRRIIRIRAVCLCIYARDKALHFNVTEFQDKYHPTSACDICHP